MENIKSSVALNLSNQANVYKSRKSNLSQFNFFVVLGVEYLQEFSSKESIPIAIDINKSGELTLNGLDESLVNDDNIFIYCDKKVTNSDS